MILLHRDDDGQKRPVVVTPEWYFYVHVQDATRHRELFINLKSEGLCYRYVTYGANKNYIQVYCQNANVPEYKVKEGVLDARTVVLDRLKRAGVPTYEADLSSLQRLRIDRQLPIAQEYKTVYLDIETKDVDDRGNRIPIQIGAQPILSCALWFADGSHVWLGYRPEQEILLGIAEVVEAADIVITFNGDGFDIPYIEERCKLFGIPFHTRSMIHLDLYAWFKKAHAFNAEITSYGLDALSKALLGEEKVHYEGTLYNLYQSDPERFKLYNLQDTRLCWLLNQKEIVVPQIVQRCQIGRVFLPEYIGRHQGYYPSLLIDGFVTNRAYLEGRPVSSAEHRTKDGKFRGALVYPVTPGRYTQVATLDFSTLYPSIIRTWNIGPETMIHAEAPPPGATTSALNKVIELGLRDKKDLKAKVQDENVYFDLEVESVLAEATKAFNAERKRCRDRMKILAKAFESEIEAGKSKDDAWVKDRADALAKAGDPGAQEWRRLDLEQAAWKILANAVYGATGMPLFRFFRREVAESITIGGRAIWRYTGNWFDSHGLKMIAGDTDSVFVVLFEGVNMDEILEKFHKDIANWLRDTFGCVNSYISLAFEKTWTKLIYVRKKCYFGLIGGSFKGKGLEHKKRATPGIAKSIYELVVKDLVYKDRDASFYVTKLAQWQKRMFTDPVTPETLKQFVVHKTVAEAYTPGKKLPVHARVFAQMQAAGMETMAGMRVPYVKVISVTDDKEDGVHPELYFRSGRELDRASYWNTEVFGRLYPVLRAVFPNEDWQRFDTDVVAKRRKQTDAWLKGMKDPRKFKAVLKAVDDAKIGNPGGWLTTDLHQRIVRSVSEDERKVLEHKMRQWLWKRLPRFQELEIRAGVRCPKCGLSNSEHGEPTLEIGSTDVVYSGFVQGTKYRTAKILCFGCSHEGEPPKEPEIEDEDEVDDVDLDDEDEGD